MFALGGTEGSRRRYGKMVLLQGFRRSQHPKYVGERLIWQYLESDGTARRPQRGATAAPVLQDKNHHDLPRPGFVRVSRLHRSSLFPSRIG